MNAVRALVASLILGLFAACAGTRPTEVAVGSTSPATTIRGNVDYRERMALPDDATVDIWITDIGSGIVTMAILGETTIAARGRQVPLPFEVPIDPARVNAERPYGIRAAIRSGGAMLFETREPTPVLTQGHPTTVTLMLARVAPETPAVPAATPALAGTAWRLEDLGGTPVVSGIDATLEFPDAGRVAGQASCNRFFGPVTITGDAIQFGVLGSTRMACPDPASAQETKYLSALRGANRFEVDGTTLRLFSTGLPTPLRFTRTKP